MLENPQALLEGLIAQAGAAFVTYLDPEGYPVARAMLPPREREGLRVFWFTTNTSSNKVRCYRENPKASVYFADTRSFWGVSLTGSMEVLETPEARERIWRQGDTLYYPGGVTDPDYCVLRFTAQGGRYYSSFHSENFSL